MVEIANTRLDLVLLEPVHFQTARVDISPGHLQADKVRQVIGVGERVSAGLGDDSGLVFLRWRRRLIGSGRLVRFHDPRRGHGPAARLQLPQNLQRSRTGAHALKFFDERIAESEAEFLALEILRNFPVLQALLNGGLQHVPELLVAKTLLSPRHRSAKEHHCKQSLHDPIVAEKFRGFG